MNQVTPIRKTVRVRSPRHLARIRTLRCCVPYCPGQPIEAHHVRIGAGVGIKPSDDAVTPLCQFHHRQLHDTGRHTFEGRYAVDLSAIARRHAAASRALGLLPKDSEA